MDQNVDLDMKSPPDGVAPATTGAPDAGAWRGQQALWFRAELARAMQRAADQHRERLASALLQDAAAQVDRTRSRGAIETGELRRMAEEDMDRIRAWCDSEIDLIRTEATRRTDDRNRRLDEVLQHHHGMLDAEIEAVARAVREYRAALDAYFNDMGASTDPAYIARQAGTVPEPPDLEGIRGGARAEAVGALDVPDDDGGEAASPESPTPAAAAIGVMDPAAIGTVAPLPAVTESTDPAAETVPAHANAAVRLIRSIAGLAGQAPGGQPDHQEQPR